MKRLYTTAAITISLLGLSAGPLAGQERESSRTESREERNHSRDERNRRYLIRSEVVEHGRRTERSAARSGDDRRR